MMRNVCGLKIVQAGRFAAEPRGIGQIRAVTRIDPDIKEMLPAIHFEDSSLRVRNWITPQRDAVERYITTIGKVNSAFRGIGTQ